VLAYTNTITGESRTNKIVGLAAAVAFTWDWVIPDISTNDYGSILDQSTGTGSTITINSATWKLK
jgi:hypothetical protein